MTHETEKFEKLVGKWQEFSEEIHGLLREVHDATATTAKASNEKPWAPTVQELKAQLANSEARVEQLEAQLPEDMKHCTIVFSQCERGHGRLTAANYQDQCPWCKIESLQAQLTANRKALGKYNSPNVSLPYIVETLAKGVENEIEMKCNYRKELEAVEQERNTLLCRLAEVKQCVNRAYEPIGSKVNLT